MANNPPKIRPVCFSCNFLPRWTWTEPNLRNCFYLMKVFLFFKGHSGCFVFVTRINSAWTETRSRARTGRLTLPGGNTLSTPQRRPLQVQTDTKTQEETQQNYWNKRLIIHNRCARISFNLFASGEKESSYFLISQLRWCSGELITQLLRLS